MIAVTLFPPGEYARGKRSEWTWDKLAEYIHCCALIALPEGASKDEISIAKASVGGFCLAHFKGDHRGLERLEYTNAIGLDFDSSPLAPSVVHEKLSRYRHIIYSTFQHTAAKPRYRAIVELSRPVNAGEYRLLWQRAAERFQGIDTSAKDASRLWYRPAQWEGRPWVFLERQAANPLDVDATLRSIIPTRPPPKNNVFPLKASASIARRYIAKMPASVSGQRGHDAAFAVARRLIQDFKLSESEAWPILLEFNERCDPPWKEHHLKHKIESAKKARVSVAMGRKR